MADWDNMARVAIKTRGQAFRRIGRVFQNPDRAFGFLLMLQKLGRVFEKLGRVF